MKRPKFSRIAGPELQSSPCKFPILFDFHPSKTTFQSLKANFPNHRSLTGKQPLSAICKGDNIENGTAKRRKQKPKIETIELRFRNPLFLVVQLVCVHNQRVTASGKSPELIHSKCASQTNRKGKFGGKFIYFCG